MSDINKSENSLKLHDCFELKVCYHCPSESLAKQFCSQLNLLGYKWRSGNSLLEDTRWNCYSNYTAYVVMDDHIAFSNIESFKNDGYEIIQYNGEKLIKGEDDNERNHE
jgi:hypothetical protein